MATPYKGKILFTDDKSAPEMQQTPQTPYKGKILFTDDESGGEAPQTPNNSWIDMAANHPITQGVLGAGDAVRQLLSLGLANPNPTNTHSPAYNVGHLVGDVGSFVGGGSLLKAAPYVRAIPHALESIPKIGPLISRMLGSTAYGAALNPEDRLKGAEQGAESGAIGEAIGAPVRALAGVAEKINPIRAAVRTQQQIHKEAQQARHAMEQAYAPVHAEHGGKLVTRDPRNYLGYHTNETRYFTPDVRRSYDTFLSDPTFEHLHKLQSQMGADAARMAHTPSKLNTYQTLSNLRKELLDETIPNYLGRGSPMQEQYENARRIGREQYYPYLTGENLTKISQGRKSDLTPRQLTKAISTAIESKPANNPLPFNHKLRKHLANVTGKINRGEGLKNAGTAAVTIAGLLKSPELGGILGLGTHFGGPAITNLLQNPAIINLGNNKLNPALRGFLEQYTNQR